MHSQDRLEPNVLPVLYKRERSAKPAMSVLVVVCPARAKELDAQLSTAGVSTAGQLVSLGFMGQEALLQGLLALCPSADLAFAVHQLGAYIAAEIAKAREAWAHTAVHRRTAYFRGAGAPDA
ncbi:hypothetical protein HDZ31DRAFT_67132 [Schizophyllum fasciatum]